MKRLQRLISCFTMLVGVIGIATSIYAVSFTWKASKRMSREVPRAIGQVETVVDTVHQRGDLAVDVLQNTRDRLGEVHQMVADFSGNSQEREVTTFLNTLDAEVMTRLEQAEEFIRSMQNGMESASGALVVLESIPFLSKSVKQGERSDADLDTLAVSLQDVSSALDQLAVILAEIREKRRVDPSQVARMQAAIDRVDDQLSEVQGEIDTLTSEVKLLSLRLRAVRLKSPSWIRNVAWFATVFFFCFAYSQLHLIRQAWSRLSLRQ